MPEKKETKEPLVSEVLMVNEVNVESLVPRVCLVRWDPAVNLVSRDHQVSLDHQEQEVYPVSQDPRVTWEPKENLVLQDNKVLLGHKVSLVLRDQWVHQEVRVHLENQVFLVFLVLMVFQVIPVTRVQLDPKVPWVDPVHKVLKDILDPVALKEKMVSEVLKGTRETKVLMV